MSRAIITYAEGPHEELLDVALPTYRAFAERHGYELIVERARTVNLPAPWNKIPCLIDQLENHTEVVWFDCDLVVVNSTDDFPQMEGWKTHSLVRHFAWESEVPNSGVWRVKKGARELLVRILDLDVFTDHGWWEQAALMTLMGYTVPPQGSDFRDTKCRCVRKTRWYEECQFMRLCWNSHPNYRAEHPRIVHCSYPDMERRLEVMRALVRDPHYDYPKYGIPEKEVQH